MNIKQPTINSKYTFRLVREDTNELLQEVVTHNEITKFFWVTGEWYGMAITLSSYTGEQNNADDYCSLKEPICMREATAAGVKEPNIMTYQFVVPADTKYVFTIGSFGITHQGSNVDPGKWYNGSDTHHYYTRGQLKDAEGNPITINKTALDKLIIDVEWQLNFIDGDFTWFKGWDNAMNHAQQYYAEDLSVGFEFTKILTNDIYISTLPIDKGKVSHRQYYWSRHGMAESSWYSTLNWMYTLTPNWKKSAMTSYAYKPTETPQIRIAQESLPGRYINTIGIHGAGAIQLPNSNIFPKYTMQDIDVGTGDGSTTDFECPIPWFLKDTDKVYKNGVLLTRDVDYTIDHKHNRQKCLSISEGNFAKIIDGCIYRYIATGRSAYVTLWGCIFMPFSACIDTPGSYLESYFFHDIPFYKMSTSKPMILDMEKETEINYFVSPYIKGGDKLKLYYSNDNNSYTYVGEVNVLSTHIAAGSSIPAANTLSFNTIKARYWKVEITSKDGSDAEYEFDNYTNSNSTSNIEETKTYMYNQCGFLGYVGEPIKFKTPPAKGDIITMDVSLDRPYKTTQNVIDIAFKYNY